MRPRARLAGNRARRVPMPISVQLSLELDDVPAPPPGIAERLPEQAVSVAVGRPAGLPTATDTACSGSRSAIPGGGAGTSSSSRLNCTLIGMGTLLARFPASLARGRIGGRQARADGLRGQQVGQ